MLIQGDIVIKVDKNMFFYRYNSKEFNIKIIIDFSFNFSYN